MKITVIGCGNAFSQKSFNQSFLVEEGDSKMLIDCGMQTPQALANAGINLKAITDIYISHAHADHAGGLEYVAFSRYDWLHHPRSYMQSSFGYDTCYAPRLIANKQLLQDLWNKTLSGGLESMEGFVADLNTYFIPFPIEPNKPFMWEGWKVDLIQQIHIMSGSIIMPSFGIMFSKENHKSVYFVTDSQHCSPRQQEEYYKKADIIFQDCECTGVNFQFKEGDSFYKDEEGKYKLWPQTIDELAFNTVYATAKELTFTCEEWACFKFSSGVHANYAQLAGYSSANSVKLSSDIKKKMWLSHYQDFVLDGKDMYGNSVDWDAQADADGFAGFVKVNQKFEV